MLFLATCRSLFPLLIFLASSWYEKAKIGLRMSLRNKKWLIIILEELTKQPVIKPNPTKPKFFLYHWLLHRCFFSILIKALANFEKLIRFHWQAFIVHKNGDNLKMLMQVFCQKRTDSNVFLAFLTLLKPKIFFVGQSLWPT